MDNKYLKLVVFLVGVFLVSVGHAASIGWAVPKSLVQESDILQVEFPASAPKSGLPSCATRTYIDIRTDAGKMRASLALAAFAAQKEMFVRIEDGIQFCGYSSSVPNRWIRVRD